MKSEGPSGGGTTGSFDGQRLTNHQSQTGRRWPQPFTRRTTGARWSAEQWASNNVKQTDQGQLKRRSGNGHAKPEHRNRPPEHAGRGPGLRLQVVLNAAR
jgi:hypothetical protein